jgi:hypothetical protein
MSLFHTPIPVGSSRVKGAHVTLRRLIPHRKSGDKIRIANVRTLQGRRSTDEARRWMQRVHDVLSDHDDDLYALIAEGERLFGHVSDPKIDKRARKRGAA